MPGIVRVNLLYNVPARPEQPATPTKPSRPARPGRLGVSRSTFHDNIVWHSDDDPFIPNTDVKRLKLLYLAPNAAAAFEDEVAELEAGLKRYRDRSFAQQRDANPVKSAALKRRRPGLGSKPEARVT